MQTLAQPRLVSVGEELTHAFKNQKSVSEEIMLISDFSLPLIEEARRIGIHGEEKFFREARPHGGNMASFGYFRLERVQSKMTIANFLNPPNRFRASERGANRREALSLIESCSKAIGDERIVCINTGFILDLMVSPFALTLVRKGEAFVAGMLPDRMLLQGDLVLMRVRI